MKVTRRSVLGFAATLGLTLAACGAGPTFIVQQYRGPQRPPESVAVLRMNGGDTVRLLFLDEEDVAAPIASDSRLHIEMLPARHTLTVADTSAPNERFAPVSFQAEPGKVYRVAIGPGGPADSTTTAHVFEVDRGKDTAVRDVTMPVAGAAEGPRSARPVRSGPVVERSEDAGGASADRGDADGG